MAQIAEKYYGKDKLYVFNGLHNDPNGPTFEERDSARPVISNLFDTFVAVSVCYWRIIQKREKTNSERFCVASIKKCLACFEGKRPALALRYTVWYTVFVYVRCYCSIF